MNCQIWIRTGRTLKASLGYNQYTLILFRNKNDIDFSEIKKQILTKKTVKLKLLITWHKQRLAEGSHAKVFEAFSFREEAAGNCWQKAKKVSLSNKYYRVSLYLL